MMPRGIFSSPKTSTQSWRPLATAAARAARLDVHDRHTREPEGGQHLVAGRHAAVDGAAEGGPEGAPPDPGVGERLAHGVHAERGEALLREAAEGMEADAGHVDRPHASSGRKA